MIAAILICGTTTTFAQWRAGVTAGTSYNIHSMDLQYMNDFRLEGRWGATLGVTGQYDLTDWRKGSIACHQQSLTVVRNIA